jgi:TolA protein
MSNSKNRTRGIISTAIFHFILVAILYLFGFHTPLPLPEEEGVLVNFGNSDNGLGNGPIAQATAPEPIAPPEPESELEPEPEEPEVVTPPEPVKTPEKVITQDNEEAPAVPTAEEIAKEKAKKEKERKEKVERERKKKLEQERKRKEEQKRKEEELKRKKEAERKRKEAEAEKKRQEEIARKKREEAARKAKINAINNKAKNIFGQGSSNNSSQGKTFPSGNQGKQNGSTSSNNYKGKGLGEKGISYSLDGRSAVAVPKPAKTFQESGKVVVEITVDKNGKVINARPGIAGSTTSSSALFAAAQKAALRAKFNPDPNAPAFQQGTITYLFELN